MKTSFAILALLLAVHIKKTEALEQHPVRDEIVEKIKSSTNKWKPMEVS